MVRVAATADADRYEYLVAADSGSIFSYLQMLSTLTTIMCIVCVYLSYRFEVMSLIQRNMVNNDGTLG